MDKSCLELSIIVETATNEITHTNQLGKNISRWIAEAERAVGDQYEILVCAQELSVADKLPPNVKIITAPGAGYYALKNAGANEAKGPILFFTDADCRPCKDFFVNLIARFRSDGHQCWAGRSFYDGPDFLTTVNTVTSFGYIHDRSNVYPMPVLGHNISVSREFAGRDPFGPYPGRSGGDVYFALAMRHEGQPFRINREMVTYHENLSYDVRALYDRHMMEHFSSVLLYRKVGKNLPLWSAFRAALFSIKRRFRSVVRYGPEFGLHKIQYPFILLILMLYSLFDGAFVAAVLLTPSWRDKWLRYQFGLSEPQLLKFLQGEHHSLATAPKAPHRRAAAAL